MQRLLVCVDFSEVTTAVLDHAGALALAASAEVRLLHVVAPDPDFVGYAAGPGSVRDDVAREIRAEHRELERCAELLKERCINAAPLVIQGATVAAILEQSERFRAELVVLGSHGHGALHHLLLGSVSQGVLRGSKVPVLVVPTVRAD